MPFEFRDRRIERSALIVKRGQMARPFPRGALKLAAIAVGGIVKVEQFADVAERKAKAPAEHDQREPATVPT